MAEENSKIELIVGLGNPGSKYSQSRHNLGFILLDAYLESLPKEKLSSPWPWKDMYAGEFLKLKEDRNAPTFYLKPTTFMNLSGESVTACLAKLKIPAAVMLVIHDDLDLNPGQLKLKFGGGDGGHKGIGSILTELKSDEFWRLRVGIGKPPADFVGETNDYVLGKMSKTELESIVSKSLAALRVIVAKGPTAAMQTINQRLGQRPPSPE